MDSLKLPKVIGGAKTAPSSSSASSASASGTLTAGSGGTNTSKSPQHGVGGGAAAAAIPISVRFSAGDERVESIYQQYQGSSNGGLTPTGGALDDGSPHIKGLAASSSSGADSLSSSPHQQRAQQTNPDDLNGRNNSNSFLQGNFFNRKRSGSIEGVSPTGLAPNLIAALTPTGGSEAGGVASVGTWKLIKGKVSQTIEDIKSSKSGSNSASNSVHPSPSSGGLKADQPASRPSSHCEGVESDSEAFSVVADELPYDSVAPPPRDDSDSDVANEILLEGDVERSRLKRGLANLKSRVKSKSSAALQHHHHHHHHHHHGHQQQPQHVPSQHHPNPGLSLSSASPLHTTAALSTATISTAFGTAAIKPTAMKKSPSPSRTAVPPPVAAAASSASGSSSSSSSLRNTFLRKRRKPPVDAADAATPAALKAAGGSQASDAGAGPSEKRPGSKRSGIVSGKKDVEIESGVEMLEDMMIAHDSHDHAGGSESSATGSARAKRAGMELPLDKLSLASDHFSDIQDEDQPADGDSQRADGDSGPGDRHEENGGADEGQVLTRGRRLRVDVLAALKQTPWVLMAVLVVMLLMPVHDFLRGIFACLLGIAVTEAAWKVAQIVIESFLCTTPPEKTVFQIPEYSKMPICEIPAVEEHKTVKSYSGWMNEVNSYDPNDFHISMCSSVYVKLDGTILRLSSTTARIPKRVMWNEQPIDRSNVTFINHRTYNLLGCRIELLPLGLARKRYFNRKYPMQLIIKNCVELVPETSVDGAGGAAANAPRDHGDAASAEAKPDTASRSSNLSSQSASNSEVEERSERLEGGAAPPTNGGDNEMDFAATIMNADMQTLQDPVKREAELKEITVPCGDEVRLLLFSRGDREKEDWFRRFTAASTGEVFDQDLRLPNVRMVNEGDLQTAAAKAAVLLTAPPAAGSLPPGVTGGHQVTGDDTKTPNSEASSKSEPTRGESSKGRQRNSPASEGEKAGELEPSAAADHHDEDGDTPQDDDLFEGLLISSCAARNPPDYIRFMSLYQKACRQDQVPVYKQPASSGTKDANANKKHQKRAKRQEDDLWKGIDQSLFLGPSGSVVWTNVLIGRFLYRIITDTVIQGKIQDYLQKKLSTIKLPSYMEDVVITQINVGTTPPLIHRISQPMLDERGSWFDLDITYEGHCDITVTTKLNLLRLKRQARPLETMAGVVPTNPQPVQVIPNDLGTVSSGSSQFYQNSEDNMADAISGSAIFDSDAESSGGSSSEPESPTGAPGEGANVNEFNMFNTSPGNARRIFRIVDRFTASNFFQYATELSYVQRAMENMSANVTLRVELKGLVGRAVMNLPPPPSDRIWLSFRAPPRLWISAKPALGDKSFDWSIVTNVIESKLCEEVNKYFVYPNMVDVTVPFLGSPTYTE